MEIVKGVHQIRADFTVTPEVRRYAFCYLIVGEDCWLVDSGVAGCDQAIVMITHNEEIAQMADRIVRIEDGRITSRG